MFLLILFVTSFMGFGIYIPVMLLPIVTMYLIKTSFDKISLISLTLLLLFGVIYSLILYVYDFITLGTSFRYIFFPVILYLLGHKIAKGEQGLNKIITYFLLIITAYTLFGYSSLMNTLLKYGSIEYSTQILRGRYVLSLWDDSIVSATILNTTVSLGLSLVPLIFLKIKGTGMNKKIKVLSLICFMLSFFTIMQLGNRTGLLIIIASIIVVFLFSKKFSVLKIVKVFLFLIVLSIIYFLFSQGFLGIKSVWEETLLSVRFKEESLLDNSRIATWGAALLGVFSNPMGGRITELPLNYAHNLWLDIGYSAGILPFAIIISFMIVVLKSVHAFLRKSNILVLKYLILALFVSFMVTFMLEPIIEGAFTYFTIFCFFVGGLQSANTVNDKSKLDTQ